MLLDPGTWLRNLSRKKKCKNTADRDVEKGFNKADRKRCFEFKTSKEDPKSCAVCFDVPGIPEMVHIAPSRHVQVVQVVRVRSL